MKTSLDHAGPPIAIHGLMMIPWLHSLLASEGPSGDIGDHRRPYMAQASFQCLVLYNYAAFNIFAFFKIFFYFKFLPKESLFSNANNYFWTAMYLNFKLDLRFEKILELTIC